ncbi:lasso peptide biosynthesis B2 protein [Sphingopyxis sp. R3-92]|uniref:lasso peptide biosynthesis B2 protein n=1 Tax=Sphingopyxis sp. R3-92 TaxID=3158553 RepID=UPI003EE68425
MGWTLAPGTGFCEVGRERVFLDLRRDKYIALEGENRSTFERLRAGAPNDSEAMTRLIATGLLSSCKGPHLLSPAAVHIPGRDLAATGGGFSLPMALASVLALRRARRAMEPDRIARTIESCRARRAAIAAGPGDGAAEKLAASYSACRWVNPVPQRCLIDALALDHILLSRGLRSTLVFGVRLAPFRAHCWLQNSSFVLTGTAAEARSYTPILVVA